MRVEPYSIDSIMHTMKRGARGMSITRDEHDQWRFIRLLYYANDEYKNDFWERETLRQGPYYRPDDWPERQPIVKILAWVLMPNHFHLILKEIKEGGMSRFMQKLCGSMSMHFNSKYKEKGSLFQGSYKSRTIENDFYLQHLAPYVMVKNVFELYPGGYEQAVKNFDESWDWAVEQYPFSSLRYYVHSESSPIIDKDLLSDFFPSPAGFKAHAKEMILNRVVESRD